MATTVLVTGGTGSIGSLLCEYLSEQGLEVTILSRTKRENSKYKTFLWNLKENFIEAAAFEKCDYIIHLAGAGIADAAWTPKRKKEILDSRVKTTNLLYNFLASHDHQVKGIISASAVGYYGQITTGKTFKEEDAPGNDFVASVCKQWEEGVNRFSDLNMRTVNLRIGIVLMKKGGALEKMVQPFQYHIGSALGSGKQFIPWIHITDLKEIILHSINSILMKGAYNCCAPEPVDNMAFSKTIAKILNKNMWLPNVPEFVLKIILGERSILLTEGSKVSSEKIRQTGFNFKFPELQSALNDLLG
jgi:uncharacterized protein (TIGR01777 family)